MSRSKRALGPGNISGLNQVLKNLNTKVLMVENNSRRGLQRAGLLIKKEAVENAPHDTGHLRGSAYLRSGENFKGPWVIVGFAASYALFVHEGVNVGLGTAASNKGKKIGRGFRSEVGGPKFLELAVKENQGKIIKILKEEAKLK